MLKSLGQFLFIKFSAYFYRSTKKSRVSICHQLGQADRILICLPIEQPLVDNVMANIDWFEHIFQHARLSFFLPKTVNLTQSLHNSHQIIVYSESDLTPFGILGKKFRAWLVQESFRLVIDLSPGFNVINTQVATLSHAPLRVAFHTPETSPFYNFVIRTHAQRPFERSLQTMCTLLSMGHPPLVPEST